VNVVFLTDDDNDKDESEDESESELGNTKKTGVSTAATAC